MKAPLIVATSIRGGELAAAPVAFAWAEARLALQRRMPCEFIGPTLGYSADNIRARNRVAALVLRERPDAEHVLWWDDDQWPHDIGLVERMIATRLDLIGAPYTNKAQPLHWTHQLLDDNPEPNEQGHQPVKNVGFGFTLTSTWCLHAMTEYSYASRDPLHRAYTDHSAAGVHKTGNLFGQLLEMLPDGTEDLRSEDYSFCMRWRALGQKVWVYGGAGNIVHHAGQHAWNASEMAGGLR